MTPSFAPKALQASECYDRPLAQGERLSSVPLCRLQPKWLRMMMMMMMMRMLIIMMMMMMMTLYALTELSGASAGGGGGGGWGGSAIHASTSPDGVRLLQLTQPSQQHIIMSRRQAFITPHGIVYIRWNSVSKQNTISYCENGTRETTGCMNSIWPFFTHVPLDSRFRMSVPYTLIRRY